MARNIKGITIEIDGETKGLDKALGDVNKRSRDTAKELRDVEKLLKFNPGNTELIAQKQKLLGDQVAITSEKLGDLKSAQQEVTRQFEAGEIGEEQYRAFQREIVETESKLEHFEGQLESTKSKFEDFGDKAYAAGERLQDAGGKIKDVGGNMTKWVTGPILAGATGIIALAKASGDAADRLLDLSDITGMSTDSIQEWQYVAIHAGVETETMTNAVEGLVKKIPQLEAEGGKATESLNKLGIEYKDLKEMSPDEQVDILMKSLSAMEDPLERNAIGSQLFGGAWKDIAPILGMGADEMEALKIEANETGNVLGNESLQNANDFRAEMDKLMETLKNTGLQIGADLAPMLQETLIPLIRDQILPAVTEFAEKLKVLIDWFVALSPEIQTMILAVVGIIAAIGPALVIFGSMAQGLGAIMKLAPLLTPILSALGGAFAFLISPIGLIVLAVVALIAIFVLLWKNWDEVSEWIMEKWELFKEGAMAVFDFLIDFFVTWGTKLIDILMVPIDWIVNFFKESFENVKNKTTEVFQSIADFFSGIFETITGIFGKALDWIDEKTGGKFKSVTDTIRKYIEMAKDVLSSVWDFIKNTFQNALDFVKALVTGDFQGMKDAITKQMDNIKQTISDIWDKVMGFFKDIDLKEMGKDIIMGLINGIKDMAKKVVDSVKDVVGGAIGGAKKLLGIKSPSRVFKAIGEFSGEGLEDGLMAMGGRVKNAGQRLADSAIPTIGSAATGINVNGTSGSGGVVGGAVTIVIENMSVRNDDDINKISRQLESLMRKNKIARGDV